MNPRFDLDVAREILDRHNAAVVAYEGDPSQANADEVCASARAFYEHVGSWPIPPQYAAPEALADVPF